MSKNAIIDTGRSLRESLDMLSRTLIEVHKNDDTNPINLGITMEEYIEMTEAMNSKSKSKKKSNGFLEGKKMNKILGKRK
ncbi:hypothetical protein [Lysinibacillus sp. NPDC086135]|uniref:hypothetical protein n=1 Tax=Lysinibacillus sp. NPDC086135 TaxID=3364130 RepID=UPI0038237D80